MKSALLNEKIEVLKTLVSTDEFIAPDDISKFRESLTHLKEWDTFRINPYDFAVKYSLDPEKTLRLFIYATKASIFTFEWSLLCPYCGGREHSHDSLNQLAKELYHCTVCDVDLDVIADSLMEVSFSMNSRISGFIPDPHSSQSNYNRYFFSDHFVRPESYLKLINSQPKQRFTVLNINQKALVKINETPAMKHRIYSLDSHSVFTAFFNDRHCSDTRKIEVTHGDKGFLEKEETIDCGPAEILIKNESGKKLGVVITSPESDKIAEALQDHPPYFRQFATGKMMLNNQPFREMFLVDNLPNDLSLKISDITVMFTDLKGSTEMYNQTGDVKAYRLVQEHFSILQNLVQKNRGAIVKTMGDAIMASFNTPLEAVTSAASMIEDIDSFNKTIKENGMSIGLKIGIHRGPVIAVKANQTLDYFGQTVNIAARVQGLAESGEIFLTADVWNDRSAADFMKERNYITSEYNENLKGVAGSVSVIKCFKES